MQLIKASELTSEQLLTDLNLFVWLQSHQTADLMGARVQNACTDKVLWVGVNTTQNTNTKACQLHTRASKHHFTVSRCNNSSSQCSDLPHQPAA